MRRGRPMPPAAKLGGGGGVSSSLSTRGALTPHCCSASRSVACAASMRLRSVIWCWIDLEALTAGIEAGDCERGQAAVR